ncbi:MAG: penicillin-binding protein 2 [Proteobacteria bacterium]|nr:penicillin-binding protein 2 [Pseudomonadota bacterium]
MAPLPQRKGTALPAMEKKVTAAVAALFLVFFLLILFFWNLQVLNHDRYQRLADNNRIRIIQMPANRGIITDRNGIILADSTPDYSLAIIAEDAEDSPEETVLALANLLGREGTTAVGRFREDAARTPYRPVRVFEHLDEREVALFETLQDRFPGAVLLVVPRRYYPFDKTTSHILGYVGEISEGQLQSGEYPGAKRRDIVGKFALEKAFDRYLRGTDGGRQVEVDARGREISILGVTEPTPGANLSLTLDIRVQQELEEAFGEEKGAGVVLGARTGEVLAMVSLPAFDPNEFSLGLSRERWNEILTDPDHPLQNKVIQGIYPPGSTFKVVTAITGLMERVVSPGETLFCSGGYYYGGRVYRDWKAAGHGIVNLRKAIVESCDVYFYQTGERAGIEAMAKWGSILGLGKRTGIDLPGEVEGLLPSPAWKKRVRKQPWFPGETLSASIGQGYVLVTPLQLCNLYSTIARRGVRMDPYLVHRAVKEEGLELYRRDPMVSQETEIPQDVWNSIIQALEGVVSDPHGTGRAAGIPGYRVAGKTGTAQVVRLQETPSKEEDIPYRLRDHGWFAGFAPVEKPMFAAVVVVEHGGHGSSTAAPIVSRILKKSLEFYPPETGGERGPKEVR